MYEAFYGLREKPFNLTPDPKYLYLSEKHKEAFAHLLYGVKHRSGFVMVTGEIGTGKTTICRNLLNQLDDDVEIAFIFNPYLNPVELLKKINQEFGIDFSPDTSLELSEILNTYLLEAASQEKNCILLIDEAQNLESKVLEQIRLLSNLETETQKLLQIILIGQPELTEKLALYELRQLNQRITARYHLKPLDEKETLQYIAYRVHVAGGRKKVHFTRRAVRAVYRRSGGVPRLINAISDRALLIGYTREMRTITPAVIRKAANEIRGEQTNSSRWVNTVRGWLPSPALIAAVLLVAVLVRFVAPPLERLAREFGTFNALLSGAPATPDTEAANAVDARPVDPETPAKSQTAANSLANRVADRIVANAPAPVDPAAQLATALETADPVTTGRAALGALAAAWDRTLPELGGTPADDFAAQAQQLDLSVEKLKPALYQLLALNLPALVQVRQGEKLFWLALLKQEEETLTLVGATEEALPIPRSAFQELYAGEAIVLWPDPNPKAPALFPGRSDQQVAALKDALRRVGRIDGNATSNNYDTETASAVSRIQAETGLMVDGIAGRQVRMVLASWTGGDQLPALRPRDAVPPPAAAPVVEARRSPERRPRVTAPMPPLVLPAETNGPPQPEIPVTGSGDALPGATPAPLAGAPSAPFMNMPSLEVIDLPAPDVVVPPLAATGEGAPPTPALPE